MPEQKTTKKKKQNKNQKKNKKKDEDIRGKDFLLSKNQNVASLGGAPSSKNSANFRTRVKNIGPQSKRA